MDSSPVARLLPVADVVSANVEYAASAVIALEIKNEFLLQIKKSGVEPIAAINSKQTIVQLEATERL